MAQTASTMLPLLTFAPNFDLPDVVSGKRTSLADFSGKKLLLVMFLSRHCPYVKHIQNHLALLGKDYGPQGVGLVGICANDVENYPDDSPAALKSMVMEQGFNFPLLYDESQETAKAYRAACTPEFYLFDSNRKLIYRGQLDDSRPKNDLPVTGRDLRAALDAALGGKLVSQEQRPGIGCNIKWKKGMEPDYFAH